MANIVTTSSQPVFSTMLAAKIKLAQPLKLLTIMKRLNSYLILIAGIAIIWGSAPADAGSVIEGVKTCASEVASFARRITSFETGEDWLKKNNRYINANFNKRLKDYRKGLEVGNDSLLKLLDEASGGKVIAQLRGDGPVTLPSQEIVQAYINRKTDELVEQGRIADDQTMRPGRVFKPRAAILTGSSDLVYLPWDINFDSRRLIPIGGNSNNNILPMMISEKGLMPNGEGSSFLWTHQPQQIHDWAHGVVFLNFPETMPAIRRLMGASYTDPEITKEFARRVYGGNGILTVAMSSIGLMRGIIPFELLELVKPGRLDHLVQSMSLPPTEDVHSLKAGEVQEHLKKLSVDGKEKLLENIEKAMNHSVDYIGGATADILGVEAIIEHHTVGHEIALTSQLAFAKKALSTLKKSKSKDVEANLQEFDKTLARLQVALIQFSRITPAQWFTDVTAVKLAEDSRVRDIVCNHEIFSDNSLVYKSHCE